MNWRAAKGWRLSIRFSIVLGLALGAAPLGPALGAGGESDPRPFAVAHVHFEQNATDEDVEVVFEVQGGDEGLSELRVVSPDGRTVLDFRAPDASTLGLRSFRFESPEPKDVEGLKAAYPEGVYRFTGATAGGDPLRGESALSHALPATGTLVRPGETVPSGANLVVAWTAVPNVTSYIVEIAQEDLGVAVDATLPAGATSFTLPSGFLVPGTEYDLGLGTVTADGNASFVETSFTAGDGE